jgi:hypothetical protein
MATTITDSTLVCAMAKRGPRSRPTAKSRKNVVFGVSDILFCRTGWTPRQWDLGVRGQVRLTNASPLPERPGRSTVAGFVLPVPLVLSSDCSMRLKSHKMGPIPNHLLPAPRAGLATSVNLLKQQRFIERSGMAIDLLFLAAPDAPKSQEASVELGLNGR